MNQSRPVLLLASTGFIIRNLVLGKFADEIIKHRKLIVAVPDPDDVILKQMLLDKGIETIKFPFEIVDRKGILYEYKLLHNYYYKLKQGQKASKSLELQTKLWERPGSWKKEFFDKTLIKSGAILTKAGLFGSLEDFYIYTYSGKAITREWIKILEKTNPAFVVSTMLSHAARYQSSVDLPAILAARRLKIPMGTLIQSWDNLSSKVAILPDWLQVYWTWSESMSQELFHFYPNIDPTKVKAIGSPQFDFHLDKGILDAREEFCRENGLSSGKKFILIGTGTEKWMPDEPYKLLRLSKKIKAELPALQVLVRLHPKDHGGRWVKLEKEFQSLGVAFQYTSPNKHMDSGGFIPPRDFYKSQVNSIYHSELVLNSSSTITIDAAILDKPVICFGYDLDNDPVFPEGRSYAFTQSNHYQALIKTGGVAVVRSEQECIEAIKKYLSHPLLDAPGRKKILDLVTGLPDGNAGIRLCRHILSLL